MEKIKKLFNSSHSQHRHHKSKSDQTVIVPQATKRKRFSLVLLKSAIDPNHKQSSQQQEKKNRPTSKHTSKSTSFLQLQSFRNNNGAFKKSRSMFGQLASFNKPLGNVETEAAAATTNRSSLIAESVFQDYFNHAPESDVLHTAAVSISSAYNTINNDNIKLFLINGGNINMHQNSHLQLGIQFYEKGELENATHYWRLATEENEIMAIFFYGLALRHGWGCRKSPAIALRYLQKTTNEFTPNELQTALSRLVDAAKIESLACSIYELGEFFWHGWEVPKSVAMATWYFQLASDMDNPNAMNDLAFCFRYGHGVTKDDQQAAKLYRKAAKHGLSLENNSWIWDSQYNDGGDDKNE
ncbi:uncharacterized protein ATC70_003317 [Mucor velutinosus]|uniref:HCP-like protein n=1 Tax=Mucor velutinosus TaxID=708070 RepID=A0AAN7HLA0_9FUNG|nr:hypothetical protein ATC70_003317 [Mucor velutinosus]